MEKYWRHYSPEKSYYKFLPDAFDAETLNQDLALRSKRVCAANVQEPCFKTIGSDDTFLALSVVSFALRNCRKTSAGFSGVPYWVYRTYWDILAPVYQYVWNLSLLKGIFPDCYKLADITPLPKKPLTDIVNDVRGISVTPIAARIFEKLVHQKYILPGIVQHGDPLQFAYRPGTSTVDCLLTMQQFILDKLDKNNVDGVHCLSIDFSILCRKKS